MQRAIAILDSGVGGLTVVKEIMRHLPQEKLLYFGDTARTPYGPRNSEEVLLFTKQIVEYLLHYQPKMIVIACNTATAVALNEIRRMTEIPVIGVIHPGARAAIQFTRTNKVGVIGTEGTIRSSAYEMALKELSPEIETFSLACPTLVPLVEQGMFTGEKTQNIVREALGPIINKPIDCMILGCTHYPFLTDVISNVMGPNIQIISSADETAREVSAVLHYQDLLAKQSEPPIHQFFCSGNPETFKDITEQWLGEHIRVNPVVWQVSHL